MSAKVSAKVKLSAKLRKSECKRERKMRETECKSERNSGKP